jgi:hypothetical protein
MPDALALRLDDSGAYPPSWCGEQPCWTLPAGPYLLDPTCMTLPA